mgnify:CR=1 FL=1
MVLTPRIEVIGVIALAADEAAVYLVVALANKEKVLLDKVALAVANLAILMEVVLKDIVNVE